ncbi:MAG: hypothetical protein M1814_005081 [Vezdaea aestivalis]|nr:MAG: hypothetical protein M1814_005081 [Vezdaea aestivalis]
MALAIRPASLPRRPGKRLIIACDGTWLNSDNGIEREQILPGLARESRQVPSNVTRITRAIQVQSDEGIPQIVYYQAGVGTGGTREKVIGGITGQGLSDHIREAYGFIAINYVPGDEIFLLGFSRGAYTARNVAALIGVVGLLTRIGLEDFYAIFKDYQNSRDPEYRDPFPDVPFPNKPNIRDPLYLDELVRRGLTRPGIKIKVVGVWDTVGALGIPRIGALSMMGTKKSAREFSFDNTYVGTHIENAFQALALDERREPFAPAIWEKKRNSPTFLKQVWFPGVHSNIGGGYDDQELANLTLAWMMSELAPFLDFHDDYLPHQIRLTRNYYRDTEQRDRPWSFGEILDSSKGVFALSGTRTRTPAGYHQIDPDTCTPTAAPLAYTHEYIHASVRARWGLGGPGIEDDGPYTCRALRKWTNAVVRVGQERRRVVVWEEEVDEDERGEGEAEVREGVRRRRGERPRKMLYEDELGDWEREVLAASPDVERKILGRKANG